MIFPTAEHDGILKECSQLSAYRISCLGVGRWYMDKTIELNVEG